MTDSRLEEYVERQRLRPVTAERLRRLDQGGRSAVLDVAVPLGLNDNQLRDVLDLAEDSAAREGVSVAEVLGDPEAAALRQRRLGRSDKIKALKAWLRRRRYPHLSAALDRIDALRARLGLPAATRLELPENLEGDELVVTLRASSVEDLRARVAQLARACDRPEIEALFDVWHEAAG